MSDLVQQLRAFVELDGGDLAVVESAADELERLTRELEEARKDAARYRWLRSEGGDPVQTCLSMLARDKSLTLENMDAAIDAAMSQEKRKDALDRMARDADELGLDF